MLGWRRINGATVLAAGVVGLSAGAGMWARQAAGSLVIELGEVRSPDRPVTAQLARALADPALELRSALQVARPRSARFSPAAAVGSPTARSAAG